MQQKKGENTRNYVHENIIHSESIMNEEKHMYKNRTTHYQVNPFNCRQKLIFQIPRLWINPHR